MGLVSNFRGANLFGKITFLLLLIANVLNWLCFTMADWGRSHYNIDDDYNGYGVWRKCNNEEPAVSCESLDGWRLKWYGAFQAFMIFAFCGLNVAFVLVVLLIFVQSCKTNKEVSTGIVISCVVAALAYLVAVIIFGVRFDKTYDGPFDGEEKASGFYLAILALILVIIACVLAILGARGGDVAPDDGSRRQQQQQPQQQEQNQKQQ